MPNQLQLVGTVFAALFGLAFGSFLNVFLVRFPEGESLAAPRSHCRRCDRTLAWWENVPLLSWLLLRGRCRQCRVWIGLRYPLVELAVGLLWVACWVRFGPPQFTGTPTPAPILFELPAGLSWTHLLGYAVLCWLLLALAILDAQYFWLPDWLTLPGIGLGLLVSMLEAKLIHENSAAFWQTTGFRLLAVLAAAGIVLFIRLAYWIVRRQEGMGLGDAKLMAMLGAWLGLRGAVECFAVSIVAAAFAALLWLAVLALHRKASGWATMPLPLGTFLCAAALAEVFFPHWLLNW